MCFCLDVANCLNSFHAFADNAGNNEASINFNAKVHYKFFKRTFEHFSINFNKWVKVQTSDKVAVSALVSLLSSKLTIPYSPHLSESEFNLIESLA